MQRQYHIESSIFLGLGRSKDILDMKFQISLRILRGKWFRSCRNQANKSLTSRQRLERRSASPLP